jgi:hypothetical protein
VLKIVYIEAGHDSADPLAESGRARTAVPIRARPSPADTAALTQAASRGFRVLGEDSPGKSM